RHGFLVPVEGLEEERVLALLERRHVPADVSARAGVLDLDHLGAQVRELQRPPRPRAELLHRENANVVERKPQATTCSPRAAPSIIASSISGLGTFGAGQAFFECVRPRPRTSSASL